MTTNQSDEFYAKRLKWIQIPNKEMFQWVKDGHSKDPITEMADWALRKMDAVLIFRPYAHGDNDGVMIGFVDDSAVLIFEDGFLEDHLFFKKKPAEIIKFPQDDDK